MMNIRWISALVLAVCLAAIAIPAAEPGKTKVLVVTGGHGFEREPFLDLFARNPDIAFTHAAHSGTNATVYEREDLLSYDVLVLYDMPKNITENQRSKFLSLLDRGTGLVVLHHALVSFQKWPDYEGIIGGRYPEGSSSSGAVTPAVGYEHDVDVPVTIVARDHPITAGLRDFTIHDEIYWGFRVGADVAPLLSTTHPRSGRPLAWTRAQSNSRIVYLQLGHDRQAFENPNFRQLVARSIGWAARPDGGITR